LALTLAAVLVAATAALVGCSGLDPTQQESSPPGGAGTAGNPGDCGGKAVDLDTALRVVTDPIGCPGAVNTLWSEQLNGAWTPTTFVEYHDGDIPPIACATQDASADDFADNALYCEADDTVAYSVEFMEELYQQGGAEYPLFVLLHEIGHRANAHADAVGAISLAEENQADCDAGVEARYANRAARLDIGDALQGGLLFFGLGDTRGGWFDNEANAEPDAHGTPRQRAQSFTFGYLRGLDTCRDLGQSQTGAV
jgi:predicted metalloprotease